MDGYQDRIVLGDGVWIDETYASDTELAHGYGQAGKRGLSKQKPCVAVAIDARKDPAAVACGHGKPSTRGTREAMGSRIEPARPSSTTGGGRTAGWSATSQRSPSPTRPTCVTRCISSA